MQRKAAAYGATDSTSCTQSKDHSMVAIKRHSAKRPKASCWQKVLFGRRIATCLAGTMYCILIMQVTVQMVMLVIGIEKLDRVYTFDDSMTLRKWIGSTTIRQSPLVQQGLGGSTMWHTERLNQTLYLRENSPPSFQPCALLSTRPREIYSDDWLRALYHAVASGTAYNLTLFNRTDIIAPVVDCTSASIKTNDTTRSRFHFLTRSTTDPDDLQLLTLNLAVQEYWIQSETQLGSAAVVSLASINDLRSNSVDYHFVLSLGYPFLEFDFRVCDLVSIDEQGIAQCHSIPRDPEHELRKLVGTAYRSGFYYSSMAKHYNIKQQNWLLESTPADAITTWRWKTKSFIQNTWAYVHIFDTALAIFIMGHLFQLSLVFYRTAKESKIWAGDVTVPASKPFLARGVVVLVFWYFTGFWELVEFCLQDAHQIAKLDTIYSFTKPMRMDVIHFVASWSGFFGRATKERIDGGVLFSVIMACFFFRASIIQISPSLIASIKELALENAQLELRSSPLSPMQLREPYPIDQYPSRLMLYVLLPTLTPVPVVVLFIAVRKVYWYYHPKVIPVQRSRTPTKTESAAAMTLHKRAFTNFELATGAHLEAMYGLLSDYDDYVFIKGMKFASADGVYAAGFLIVNKKFLVQTNDMWDIVLMKLIRVRYKNLYIFRLSGTTVQQTALLLYPHTLTMQDLLHLGISTLS